VCLHLPDTFIRRRRGPSGAERTAHSCVYGGGGDGRRGPRAGESGALRDYIYGQMTAAQRHKTVAVDVGGGAPIVVQSMTNTDTADADATAKQVAALARAGSELVRITVDRDEAAAAVPHIKDKLAKMGVA